MGAAAFDTFCFFAVDCYAADAAVDQGTLTQIILKAAWGKALRVTSDCDESKFGLVHPGFAQAQSLANTALNLVPRPRQKLAAAWNAWQLVWHILRAKA